MDHGPGGESWEGSHKNTFSLGLENERKNSTGQDRLASPVTPGGEEARGSHFTPLERASNQY